MSLTALPTLLAIPPVNLVLGAGAGAAMRRRRIGRALLWSCLVALLVLGMPIVAGCLTYPLEAGLEPMTLSEAPAPDALVILSADQQRALDAQGATIWRVGPMTLEREAAGAVLARRTHLPVLVSGGRIRPGAPSLAGEMTASLDQDFLVPVRWREERSQDTWQNLAFSAVLLRQAGIARVYLVTHAWHMRRSLIACRHAKLECVAAPVMIDARPDLSWSGFVPSVKGWMESYLAIHELIGWAWYAIRA